MNETPSIFKYKFTEEMRKMLIDTVLKEKDGKKISDTEVDRFIHVCEVTGLNPFLNQIYPNWRWNSGLERNEIVGYQTGIDGLRLTAERSKEYQGQTKPEWCGKDGKWIDVWLETEPPSAARIGIHRKGFNEPCYGLAKWDSYVPKMKSQKTGEFFVPPMWKKMPDNQLVKCAEALALRKSFPQETMGIMTREEMEQSEADKPEQPEAPKAPPAQPSVTSAPESLEKPKPIEPKLEPKKVEKSKEAEEIANSEVTNQFNAFMVRMNKEGIDASFVMETLRAGRMITEKVTDLHEVPVIVMKKIFQPKWTEAIIERYKNLKEPKNEPATANAAV